MLLYDRKALAHGVLFLLAGTAGGCASLLNTTPEEVLQRAITLAQGKRVSPLRSLLDGPALETYSDAKTLSVLRNDLRGIRSVGPLTSVPTNHTGTEFVTTAFAKTPAGEPYWYHFRIDCYIVHSETHIPFSKGTCWPDPSGMGMPDICDPDTQQHDEEWDTQYCHITSVSKVEGGFLFPVPWTPGWTF